MGTRPFAAPGKPPSVSRRLETTGATGEPPSAIRRIEHFPVLAARHLKNKEE